MVVMVVDDDAASYPAYAIVIERYHVTLYIVLLCCRIMVLNLLNLYTLIFALFGKISLMVRNAYTFDVRRAVHCNIISIYHCCVYSEKLLIINRGTVRNM